MNITIRDGRAVFRGAVTPKLMVLVSSLEGRRRWDKSGALVFEGSKRNIDILCSLGSVQVINHDELPAAPTVFDRAKVDFEKKREDFWWQARAFERCQGQRYFGFFMEQGTGKTKVAIDRSCQLFQAREISALLVITKRGVHRQWVDSHLPKDCSVPFEAQFWRGKAPDLSAFNAPDKLAVFTINWDALRSLKGYNAAVEFCKRFRGRLHIVGDESQEIKNKRSSRAKAAAGLKHFANYRTVLTGTPIAKDLTDEWAQLDWVDESIIGIKYVTTFRSQFCLMGGFNDQSVVGHKNIDEFKRLTAPHVFRITKEEIGFIPKLYDEWKFDLLPVQRQMIREVKQDLETLLASGQRVTIANAVSAMTKVQQITSGFIIDELGVTHRIMPVEKNPRAIGAMEWFEASGEKAVIWARFKEDMRILAEAMRAHSISFVEYHGDVKEADRKLSLQNFSMEGGASVFLGNPASAGTGLDGLQDWCRRALYYSNSFKAIDRWQSEDRIDRIGSTGGSQYTDMFAVGGNDRYIFNNITKKKGLSDLVLDGLEDLLREMVAELGEME